MQLRASEVREVDKRQITDGGLMTVNGRSVKTETPEMKAGDFYFAFQSITETVAVTPPTNLFARMWWKFFGVKEKEVTQLLKRLVISCPFCGMPILTTSAQTILNQNPLTIEGIIACPYAPKELTTPHAFAIKEGKIMPA